MSLRRQWCISLIITITVLMCASALINICHTRQHLLTESQEHTQDIANVLARSLAESPTSTTLLDTAFEQSNIDAIVYRDKQNTILFERNKPARTASAPRWFRHVASLKAPTITTDVTSHSSFIGQVQITANIDTIYSELWKLLSRQLMLFITAYLVLGALGYLAVYFLLQPLKRVQEQAAAICDRQFIEQQPLPKTQELRQVVEAINRMSRRLKTIFHEQLAQLDNLRTQSFFDFVTGLSNRRSFNARMQALTESEMDSCGCLMLIQINNFANYNLQHGHDAGDECLRAIAKQLQAATKDIPNALLSRRTGADFACYLPNVGIEAASAMAEHIIATSANLSILSHHQLHIGIVCCSSLHAERQLFPKADTALRQAQSLSHSGWKLYQQDSDTKAAAHEARQWFATLNRVLQDRKIFFHFQPMFSNENRELMAVEVFARINVREGVINAGVFMPMAERFDMAESFDRLIIEAIRNSSEAAHCKVPVCINLSPRSVISPAFVEWLDSYLGEHPIFARQIIVETSEYLMGTGDAPIRHLCDVLHRHGAKLSLDHFGLHGSAFAYLNSLPLDFIKIDRSFIRNIHEDADNQFYVRALIQIAHSCDITILAEGVETLQEWECLHQLGINGGQGYLLGKPDSQIKQAML